MHRFSASSKDLIDKLCYTFDTLFYTRKLNHTKSYLKGSVKSKCLIKVTRFHLRNSILLDF